LLCAALLLEPENNISCDNNAMTDHFSYNLRHRFGAFITRETERRERGRRRESEMGLSVAAALLNASPSCLSTCLPHPQFWFHVLMPTIFLLSVYWLVGRSVRVFSFASSFYMIILCDEICIYNLHSPGDYHIELLSVGHLSGLATYIKIIVKVNDNG
jgi:hypothetical protein